GLTIELGFAALPADRGPEIGIVDVPGHEDFMRTMLAGASGIDRLLLVVAADEGPMPQTREHLDVAELLGVRRGIVALSKIDRVDDDWQELVTDAVREELRRFGRDGGWPVLPVSAVTGEGIDALKEALIASASEVGSRSEADLFRLPIDRAFTIPGAGSVVTGSVWSGSVARGDAVRVMPTDEGSRVRGIQRFGREVEYVGSGARCALSLAGLSLDRVRRGDMIVADPIWRPGRRFGARIRLLADSRVSLQHTDIVRLYHGTAETLARVLLVDGTSLGPGDCTEAVLVTRDPLTLRVRDRFVLRRVSPMTTIGGGIVADLAPTRRWRSGAGDWEALLDADAEEAMGIAVRLAAGDGMDPADLPLRTGFPVTGDPDPESVVELSGRLFAPGTVRQARESVIGRVGAAHARLPRQPGVPLESIRSTGSGRYAGSLLESVLTQLEREGRLVREGPMVRLPDHRPRLTEAEDRASDGLYRLLEDGGLAPPPPAQIEKRLGIDRTLLHDLLRLLVRDGRVVAVSPELYLTAEAVRQLREGASRVLEAATPASPAALRGGS
ncbi:MAG: selenocysteine-specific translation elongation factor, partial [Gemmatimonadota bacterium]